MSLIQYFKIFAVLTIFSFAFFNYAKSVSPEESDKQIKEWEEHSENITILDTQDVEDIVKKRSALLLDVWKKDIRPEKLDPKKWMPAQRYSLPGAKWIPNAGLETLTPELRKYFKETVKHLTKGNKDAKIVFFCRRGYYSKIAAERLVKMGYTNIFLYPGTDFWEDAGKRLVIVKPEVMSSKK
jgi:PQQ-dependent catabolism-associated CXXCW motif protein